MDYKMIDWNAMWQEEAGRAHWKDNMSSRDLWDKRAESFDKSINQVKSVERRDKEDYISKMLARIEIRPEWIVLDVGSGPGTLAVPLAQRAKSVTALDVSSEMLKRLKANAARLNLNNIVYVNSSWQEAFESNGIGRHDVVVASRSLMSGDMQAALTAIAGIATQAFYLTFPIVHLPFDWEVYKAIGREKKKHPPYIYILNMLYQMGIHANLEVLYSKVKVQFASVEQAIDSLQWRTDPFTPEETVKLKKFLAKKFAEQPDAPVFTHEGKSQWALVWWRKEI